METPQSTVTPTVIPCRDWTKIVCFSCGKLGHRVGRCPQWHETFPYMWPGWSADKVGADYMMISPCVAEAPPVGKRQLIPEEGSAARISNELWTPVVVFNLIREGTQCAPYCRCSVARPGPGPVNRLAMLFVLPGTG